MLLRYASETIATISLSYNAPQGAAGQLYLCDNGTLDVTGDRVSFAGELLYEGGDGDSLEAAVIVQNREFVDAIREGREPCCSATDALASLEVLQQVYDQMVELEGEKNYRRPWGL